MSFTISANKTFTGCRRQVDVTEVVNNNLVKGEGGSRRAGDW